MTLNVLSFPDAQREDYQFVRVCRTESSGAKLESCAKESIHSEANFAGIVGQSSALRQALHLVEMVATSDATVLRGADDGTRKEELASVVNERGQRQGDVLRIVHRDAI